MGGLVGPQTFPSKILLFCSFFIFVLIWLKIFIGFRTTGLQSPVQHVCAKSSINGSKGQF